MNNQVAEDWYKDPSLAGKSAFNILNDLSIGSYGGNAKLRAWDHYDTVDLVTGKLEYPMFTESIGSPNKSISSTNNAEGSKIPTATHYTFDAIECSYVPATSKSIAEKQVLDLFLNDFIAELIILNQSPEHQFPLANILGNNFPINVDGGAVGDQMTSRNCVKGIREMLEVPIILAAQVNYDFALRSSSPTDASLAGDKIRITYKGYKLSAN
jgi:hypothetical protein